MKPAEFVERYGDRILAFLNDIAQELRRERIFVDNPGWSYRPPLEFEWWVQTYTWGKTPEPGDYDYDISVQLQDYMKWKAVRLAMFVGPPGKDQVEVAPERHARLDDPEALEAQVGYFEDPAVQSRIVRSTKRLIERARKIARHHGAKHWMPGLGAAAGPPDEEAVKAVFRKHFAATKDSAEAWNRTLDEFMPFSPEMTEEDDKIRRRVGDLLRKISREVETEEGDPFWLAVDRAMEWLRRDRALEAVHETWRDILNEIKEEIKRYKKGPKEWSPRKLPLEKGPQSVEEALEQLEGPYLYIMFDDHGNLDNWTIDHPQYFQGHGGPVASISVHESTTWDDIEDAISEELGQADIEWETENDEA